MKFIVIGITDSPRPWLPPALLQVISQGRVFSGGRRHHDIVAPLLPRGAQWIDITAPLDGVFRQYDLAARTADTATIIVFASGDPLFFGFANTILRRMPGAQVEVHPAFNSLQLLAHRLLMPYHDMRIVSLTGRPWPALDRALIEREAKIGVLTDREHTPAAIARRMLDYGYTYYNMCVGEHLGNPALERVATLTLAEAAHRDFAHPNCAILVSGAVPGAVPGSQSVASVARPFGTPDAGFALLDGREKMITKMPIRLLTLQALDLPCRHVLWDVGFCTGSVSVEARLLFPHVHVVAFEVRRECEALIRENARRHGAPGIEVHIGDFLQADTAALTQESAPPDAVFIGGHGGRLKEMLARVAAVMAPGGVVVMNSVTSPVVQRMTTRPSSRQLWDDACQESGLVQAPPLRIRLNDYNPIEILKASKP